MAGYRAVLRARSSIWKGIIVLRKILPLALVATLFSPSAATAHQPVNLSKTDTTAAKGPLLVDGTVSFAVRASFTKAREVRAFRAALKAGDTLDVQYLIIDRAPENRLRPAQLPVLTITAPSGSREVIRLNERTKFFEPYTQTRYLYLGRISKAAEAGIYSFTLTSRARSAVTIAVGEREVPGEVIYGGASAPTPKASPTAPAVVTPRPTASPTLTGSVAPALTRAQVALNNTETRCWSIIDGKVYDLTSWIKSHPGGQSPIKFLCGKDGTNSFNAQHAGQSNPISRLAAFLLGPLAP